MCEHCQKILHRTRRDARRVAKRKHAGERLTAYPCPVMDGWHNGHLPPGGREVARRMRGRRVA